MTEPKKESAAAATRREAREEAAADDRQESRDAARAADDKKDPVADKRQVTAEEHGRIRAKDEDLRDEAASQRESVTAEDKSGARPPRPVPSEFTPTYPNQPRDSYKANPANQTQELPPERQAPRPDDPKDVGVGAVKPK